MVLKPDGYVGPELWGEVYVQSGGDVPAFRRPVFRVVIDDGARENEAFVGLDEAEAWLSLMLDSVRRAKAVSP